MKKAFLTVTALLLFIFGMPAKAQEKHARSLNYYPDGRDIVCVNGQNRYTRALYGGNTLFRLETSDRPLFATYNNEKSKNIRFYLTYHGLTLRLDSTDYCEARYNGGWRGYKVRDKRWGTAELQVNSLARLDNEGAVWQFKASGFEGDVRLSVKICQTAVLKMNRGGDLGLVPRSNFDPSQDGKGLKTLEWDAAGETYLVFSDNEMLEHPDTEKGREIYTLTDEGRKAIVGRVEFTTPDPYINTLGANICAAADGTWDGQTWQHGAIGWRVPLAGWRGGYSGDALGWPERQKSHFDAYTKSIVTNVPQTYPLPSQDLKFLLARAEKKWGTGMYSNGYLCRLPGRNDVMNHYDMNLNFFDELFWHFRYDADTTYLRKMWPYIKLHLEWEKRNWDADGDHLYDAYCCIWASDALYYNGGDVTHSSAYNYKGNRFAARIAELLGEDPTPWQQEADGILEAMNERLWLKDEGHWAEFEDLMGKRRLHKSAAVWSIYTPIDCDACTSEQAWMATEYVDREIPHIPIRIKDSDKDGIYQTVATTNWLPYDWSTNNVAHEEVMNTALAYFQAGRSEQGFNLLMADILDGMFLGQSPGNFGQISYYDKARSEAYRDFADNVGISSRTLINGLFGILPDALFGKCYIKPAFPEEWDSCSVRTPFLSYKFHRTATQDIYEIEQNFAQPLKMIVKTSIGRGVFVETEGISDKKQIIVVDRTNLPKGKRNTIVNSSKTIAESQSYLTLMGLDEPTQSAKYKTVDISKYFNANVDDIFKNEYLSPRPPYTSLEMPLHGIGQWCHPERMVTIEDDGFRAKISKKLFDTGMGFSFISPTTGHNIVYTSLWDNYPDSIDIPLKGKANAAWLLMAGSTNEMQSRIDNGLVIAYYADGSQDTLRLENPTNWCPIEQDYYLDGLAFTAAAQRPYRVHLGSGTVSRHLAPIVGICNWEGKPRKDFDSAEPQIIENGAAQMLKMPLNPKKSLRRLQLRTLSNDVVIGIMGITLESAPK